VAIDSLAVVGCFFEKRGESIGGDVESFDPFAGLCMGEEVGVDVLLVVTAFGDGEDGFVEVEGFAHELITGGADEGFAGGEIAHKAIGADGMEGQVTLGWVFAHAIDMSWSWEAIERLEDWGWHWAAEVGDEVVTGGGSGLLDLRAEEYSHLDHVLAVGTQGWEVEGGYDGGGGRRVVGSDDAGHVGSVEPEPEREGVEVVGEQEVLVIEADEGKAGFACGSWEGWFEVGEDEMGLFPFDDVAEDRHQTAESAQIADRCEESAAVVQSADAVVGEAKAAYSADAHWGVAVEWGEELEGLAEGEEGDLMILLAEGLDDGAGPGGMTSAVAGEAKEDFGHGVLSWGWSLARLDGCFVTVELRVTHEYLEAGDGGWEEEA